MNSSYGGRLARGAKRSCKKNQQFCDSGKLATIHTKGLVKFGYKWNVKIKKSKQFPRLLVIYYKMIYIYGDF